MTANHIVVRTPGRTSHSASVATRAKKAGEQVGEPGEGEQGGGDAAVAAGLQAPSGDADVEHGDAQPEGVGELPRHRREHVAAVDVETAVEEERDGGDGQQRRPGEGEPAEATHRPGRGRKTHHAGDDHQLHATP